MKGFFISFEGLDGSGKSTQINRLREYFKAHGYDVLLTREPGGCPVSERIRDIILDKANPMDAVTEALLYAASRAEHVRTVIRPALEAGRTVISDRYVDSSAAYQGFGRELGYERVMDINRHAIGDLWPDATFYMEMPRDMALKRIAMPLDRLESEGEKFFTRVMAGYEKIVEKSAGRIVPIDATQGIDEVFAQILHKIEPMILNRRDP
jgi:dTMP kinase